MSAGYFLSGLLPGRLFPTNYWPGYGVIGDVGVRVINEILYPGAFPGTPSIAKTTFVSPAMAQAAGSTVVYGADLIDYTGNAVADTLITGLTLSIVDTTNGTVVNSVSSANILNTGRGVLSKGHLTITLSPQDTALLVVSDSIEYRSMVIDFSYPNNATGRHQVDFFLLGLAGA